MGNFGINCSLVNKFLGRFSGLFSKRSYFPDLLIRIPIRCRCQKTSCIDKVEKRFGRYRLHEDFRLRVTHEEKERRKYPIVREVV